MKATTIGYEFRTSQFQLKLTSSHIQMKIVFVSSEQYTARLQHTMSSMKQNKGRARKANAKALPIFNRQLLGQEGTDHRQVFARPHMHQP